MRSGLLLFLASAVLAQAQQQPGAATGARDLVVTVGKSVLVDSPTVIERVSVANGDLAEAVAVSPREVLVNGRAPGETSVIVWQQGGGRLFFDVTVRRNESHIDVVRREIARELESEDVSIEVEGETVFLRGTVPDVTAADRAVAIASTLGKPVNLLRVAVPATDQQILLKVRFADVDRAAVSQFGLNLISTGATNTQGIVTTGQFPPPAVTNVTRAGINTLTLTDVLNVFMLRPDLNLTATIKALQTRNMLQILAEPNVLAINGHTAAFLAGGEFPFPTLQGGGAGLGAVTIQFREFGVRINFTPVVTPRGSIRLTVTPEVSSLDYANGLVFNGFTIPGLNTRRVQTEVELEDGQSFAIGGLLDNRETETLSRIAGLGDIPFFGRLFRSRNVNRNNTELLVMVTPELVTPIPKGAARPDLRFPGPFLPPNTSAAPPRTPGMDVTGPPPAPPKATIPVEQLKSQSTTASNASQPPAIQFVPVPLMPSTNLPATAPLAAPTAPPTPAPAKPSGR